MQTIIPLITRPALGEQYAGQIIEIELVRQPAGRNWANVDARARIGDKVFGTVLRDLTPAEVAGFRKAGREMAGIIGVAGSRRRPVPVAIATVADHAEDAAVQTAWAKAQETGEKAHVRTWLDDVDRPDIESNQEFVDLYVEPSGKLSVVVRPVY